MAETILISNINRFDEFPKKLTVSAPYNCGMISITYDESYTEQMLYEMPNVHIDIYTSANGTETLYKFRSISISLNNGKAESSVIYDIPKSCILYIYPDFDNSAYDSHNESAVIFEEAEWTESTQTFPINIIWNNDNFLARCCCSSASQDDSGGGQSGDDTEPGGITPPTITITQPQQTEYKIGDTIDITITATVQKGTKNVQYVQFIVDDETVKTINTGVANGGTFTHTINNVSANTNIQVKCTDGYSVVSDTKDIVFNALYFYTISSTNNVTSMSNFQEMTENENGEKEFTVFANNEYIVIAFESVVNDLIMIKDNSGFNNIYSFNKSIKTFNGVEYKLYISETPVTCMNFTYYIK